MSLAFVSKGRLGLILISILFAFFLLVCRLFFLHVIESDRLESFANDVRKSHRVLSSNRGDIFDINGNILAATHATYTIGVDPNFLKAGDKSKWHHLSFILNMGYEELVAIMEQKVRKSGRLIRWSPLAKNIDLKTYEAVKKLGIIGVYGNRKNQRIYPGNDLAAHVVGFVNHESIAVSGIEKMCDYYLKGQDGWIETEKDGRRKELAHKRSREILPVNGNNVYLTIDQRIQSGVERVIESVVNIYNPEGVSIIVSRPNDGAILALANYPTFNLNEFNNTKLYPILNQKNRAISDIFEPGSTFKIVPASAVLNESIIQINDIFNTGESFISYKNQKLRLPNDHKDYPSLSMKEIIVKSSNRGAAHLGMHLGEDRLYKYAKLFGFGSVTNLGLAGEISGSLKCKDEWDSLTITRLPMGHAISGTPLQVHFATSVIANNGILMQPKIIHEISTADGDLILSYPSVVKRRVINKDVASKMAHLLELVVSEGTAKKAQINGYCVAGKTGTTQKIINGAYSNKYHVASFSGFLPVENPKVVITVIVDAPNMKSGFGYGGMVAAPAFKAIAEECIRYLQIKPSHYSKAWIAKRNIKPQ